MNWPALIGAILKAVLEFLAGLSTRQTPEKRTVVNPDDTQTVTPADRDRMWRELDGLQTPHGRAAGRDKVRDGEAGRTDPRS